MKTRQYNPADFDASVFDLNPTQLFVETEWGRELLFTQEGAPYQGKELQFEGEQYLKLHESDRFRTFYLRDGNVTLEIEDAKGEVLQIDAQSGVSYRIQKGQKFGIRTHGNSRLIEAYMPEPEQGETDRSRFSHTSYARRIEKPWGYELHFAYEGDPLMMKILHVDEGKRLSEQVHDVKEETYLNIWGNGEVVWDDSNLRSVSTLLLPDNGYRTRVGQKHRLGGLRGGIDILEISTPEAGNTWRTADDYGRPDETPEQRLIEREGM